MTAASANSPPRRPIRSASSTREREFTTASVELRSGDRLLLYSDGIVETRLEDGSRFGPERLQELLLESSAEPPTVDGQGDRARRDRRDGVRGSVTTRRSSCSPWIDGIVNGGVDRTRSNGSGNPVRNPELARSGRDARRGHRHWAHGPGKAAVRSRPSPKTCRFRPARGAPITRPRDRAARHTGVRHRWHVPPSWGFPASGPTAS